MKHESRMVLMSSYSPQQTVHLEAYKWQTSKFYSLPQVDWLFGPSFLTNQKHEGMQSEKVYLLGMH